jgi:DNA-binding transcriptional MerR regulator
LRRFRRIFANSHRVPQQVTTPVVPNRPVFRAQEVCELAEVQPYVLRSWESEFPDLGVARNGTGPRVYRRADVERVLRIKQLVFVDGLTLAGARRKLSEEGPAGPAESVEDADVAAMIDDGMRQQLRELRRELNWILSVLSGEGGEAAGYFLAAPATNGRGASAGGRSAKPAKSSSSAGKTGAAKTARGRGR